MPNVIFPKGLYELMDAYDGFIIDQWGVLHNGIEANSKAIETLKQLRKAKKQVVILSNSAKRSEDNKERLKDMGFSGTYYIDVVTSGEVTWQGLSKQEEEPFKNIGHKCYMMSKRDDYSLLKGLDIEQVENIEEADFILMTGIVPEAKDLNYFDEIFKKAIAKRIPAICANPDIVAQQGAEIVYVPGAFAKRYHQLGGSVHYIGKPHKTIFRYCTKLFENVIPSRILVIGDSIKHDVAGAAAVDLDCMFITSGIHRIDLKKARTVEAKRKAVNHMISLFGSTSPKYAMNELIWQTKEGLIEERRRLRLKE